MNADERRWPRMNRALIAAVGLLVGSVPWSAFAATPIPPGKWSFTFTDAKGQPERPIRVFTYRPAKCDTRCPIVFVMHGQKRDASRYRDYWELLADNHNLLVVATSSPKALARAAYKPGGHGEQADREKWTYSAIEHLFDEVRDGHNGYAIFGHSAGGQFVQRMALFRPTTAPRRWSRRTRVVRDAEWRKDKAAEKFPYSLVESPAGEAEVRQACAALRAAARREGRRSRRRQTQPERRREEAGGTPARARRELLQGRDRRGRRARREIRLGAERGADTAHDGAASAASPRRRSTESDEHARRERTVDTPSRRWTSRCRSRGSAASRSRDASDLYIPPEALSVSSRPSRGRGPAAVPHPQALARHPRHPHGGAHAPVHGIRRDDARRPARARRRVPADGRAADRDQSRLLLPRPKRDEEGEAEDPRAELVRRLLEYER